MFNTGFIDPRPAQTRKRAQSIAENLRDMDGIGRWGLHLSEEEHNWLVQANPDTLGHGDSAIAKAYWHKFLTAPESKPYRMQNV